jgi:hypothetical protein
MLALERIGASDDLPMLSVRNRTTEKSLVVSCRLLRPAVRSQGVRKILDRPAARRHAVPVGSRAPLTCPAPHWYFADLNPSRACLVFVGVLSTFSIRQHIGFFLRRDAISQCKLSRQIHILPESKSLYRWAEKIYGDRLRIRR